MVVICLAFRSASQQEDIIQLRHEKTLLEDKVGELEGNVSNLQYRVDQSQTSSKYDTFLTYSVFLMLLC